LGPTSVQNSGRLAPFSSLSRVRAIESSGFLERAGIETKSETSDQTLTSLPSPPSGGVPNVRVNVSPSVTTLPSVEGPSGLCLVGFLPSTLSKRFFLLGSGKRTQRTAYTVRNHGSESFVAEETVETDALNLASSTKVQSPLKTRFEESDHVRKSEEICGQITQQPPTSRICQASVPSNSVPRQHRSCKHSKLTRFGSDYAF